MLATLVYDNVSEGRHVLLAMLIVGLIFVGAIAIGEFAHAANNRRKARRRARKAIY
jgi:hypothetical protein